MRSIVAGLIGSAIGFMLWGVYSCLFVVTLWAVRRQGTDKWTSPVMATLIALYVLIFMMNVINVVNMYYNFVPQAVKHANTFPIIGTFWNLFTTLSVMLADGMIAWRCWVIWLRDWKIMVIPVLLLAAQVGASLPLVILQFLKAIGKPTKDGAVVYKGAGSASIYLSLALTVIVTTLIVGRLWRVHRMVKGNFSDPEATTRPSGQYIQVILALVESGSLYTLFLVAYVISFNVGNGAVQFLFMSSLPAVVGIAPTLIQLQRSLGYLQPSERPAPSLQNMEVIGGNPTVIRFAELGTEISSYQTRTVVKGSSSEKSEDNV